MLSRRRLLQSTHSGFAWLAFTALAHQDALAARRQEAEGLAAREPHFAPKAKRVIFLCMEGAPSHVDTFDYKPKLKEDDGKPSPRGLGGVRGGKLLGSPFEFAQHGESGQWISSLFPEVARHADKLCILNGVHTDLPNHAQAFLQMHCGIFQFPRPSLGSWVLYGLGTVNQNLPGFVTINPPQTNGGSANYGSSFLPAVYQGTRIGRGEQVSNLRNDLRRPEEQRMQLDFVQDLNRQLASSRGGDAELEGLIASYELAFRMQQELPGVLDLKQESYSTLQRYGITDSGGRGSSRGPFGSGQNSGGGTFGRQCLLARRLVENGVRFVEVTMGGWDHHRELRESLTKSCESVDRPIAGLLADLEERDLLKDTLVIWGGEFGRTPHAQGDGRDHNNKGYTMWMAGSGVKGGLRYGATDDYGFEAVEGKVHTHDWHATVLHLLGLNHESLTWRYAGRDMRLTDVKGNVIHEILS